MTLCILYQGVLHTFALGRSGCGRIRLGLFGSNKEEYRRGCRQRGRAKVVCKGFVRDVYEDTILAILRKVCYSQRVTLRKASGASEQRRGQARLLHTLITYVFSVVPRLLPYSIANLNLPLHTPRSIVTLLDMLTTSTPSVGTGGSFGGACWHHRKHIAHRLTSMQDRYHNFG